MHVVNGFEQDFRGTRLHQITVRADLQRAEDAFTLAKALRSVYGKPWDPDHAPVNSALLWLRRRPGRMAA